MKANWQTALASFVQSVNVNPGLLLGLFLILMALVLVLYAIKALRSGSKVSSQSGTLSPDDINAMNPSSMDGASLQKPGGLLRTLTGRVNIKTTVRVAEPTVVRLEADALQKAQDLLKSGMDMDSVCREINPDYVKWGSLEQRLFQRAMETLLKSQRSTPS